MKYVFDRGSMSFGGKEDETWAFENGWILVYSHTNFTDVVTMEPLLVIAPYMTDAFEAHLNSERAKGYAKYGVAAPGFGQAKLDMLSDIALCCGIQVDGPIGNQVRKVIIDPLETTILFDTDVSARLREIDALIAKSTGYDREQLEQRRGNFRAV
jgi:hypothetical protein